MFNWFYKEDDMKKQQDSAILAHKTMLSNMEQQTQKHLEKQKQLLLNSQKVLSDESIVQLSNLLKIQKQAWDINKQKMKEYMQKNNTIQTGVRITYKSSTQHSCTKCHTIFLSSEDPKSLASNIYSNPADYLTKRLGVQYLEGIVSIEIVKQNDTNLLYKIAKHLNIDAKDVKSTQELEMLINNHIEYAPVENNKNGYSRTRDSALEKGMKE